jgi:hypothetical protein
MDGLSAFEKPEILQNLGRLVRRFEKVVPSSLR